MAIREDLVVSAANFLRDPSVAASPIESRVAFLQAKNLTQAEVDAALARAASTETTPATASYPASLPLAARQAPPQPPYYGQQYPPYAWQQPPPEVARRDWRDWFIMATVVSGVSYGLFSLTKRYIYPLVAPPTPERLESDKKAIDDQFERAFALVEQLAKDTEALKAAEQQRTERLDASLLELESVIADLKSANRRREDDTQRLREDVSALQASLPKALDAQKDLTNKRLKDVNTELASIKTLISQRMSAATIPSATTAGAGAGSYLRPSSSSAVPASSPAATSGIENDASTAGAGVEAGGSGSEAPKAQDVTSNPSRPSFGLGSGMPGSRAIPEWQRAMSAKSPAPSSINGAEGTSGSSAS